MKIKTLPGTSRSVEGACRVLDDDVEKASFNVPSYMHSAVDNSTQYGIFDTAQASQHPPP